jgi:hypothetical protein
MMDRLENIDTPPPSVLGAQTDASSSDDDELAEYLRKESEEYSKTLEKRGPEDTSKDSLKKLAEEVLVRPPVAEFLESFNSETEVDSRKPTDLPDERRDNDPDLSEFLTPKLGQTTGTGLSLEGGIESLLPPSLTGGGTGDGTGRGAGGGTGDGTGGDSYSALESRIAKMLDDREKSAESDKFLALAQAGLALMASDSPTLGGAIGEAGLVGISQLRDARNQYDKDILGLLSTQADIDAARSDAALTERRLDLESRGLDLEELALDTTGYKPSDLLDYLSALQKQQTTLSEQIDKNIVGENDLAKQTYLSNQVEIERIKKLLGYGSSTKDLAD